LDHVIDLPGPGVAGTPGWTSFLSSGWAVPAAEVEARIAAISPDDVCDVIFTSGTTGQPKGVMLRHGPSLRYYGGAYRATSALDESSRQLVITPFFHCFGYKAGWMVGLQNGAVTYALSIFDPVEAMRIVTGSGITHMPGSPTMFSAILDHPDRDRYDLSSLSTSLISAATVPAPLVHRVRDELGVRRTLTGYGLTENHALVSLSEPDDTVDVVTTTSGRILDDVVYRVVDDEGDDVPAGSQGELLLSGPLVMSGYYDEPDATAAVVVDGWLHTGDVVRVGANRYVTITDRKKDLYINGGFNVSPAEVERVLAGAPGVAQIAVVGAPDDRFGEVGAAFVVPAPDRTPSGDEVIAYAREHLANYKVPRYVTLVDELPLNATGKVLKHVLRERVRGGS
jgi:acyl-CoA synthetase (AMP-forming)/AMP-acid ligase II